MSKRKLVAIAEVHVAPGDIIAPGGEFSYTDHAALVAAGHAKYVAKAKAKQSGSSEEQEAGEDETAGDDVGSDLVSDQDPQSTGQDDNG